MGNGFMRFKMRNIPCTIANDGSIAVHHGFAGYGDYVAEDFLEVETKPWFKGLVSVYGPLIEKW